MLKTALEITTNSQYSDRCKVRAACRGVKTRLGAIATGAIGKRANSTTNAIYYDLLYICQKLTRIHIRTILLQKIQIHIYFTHNSSYIQVQRMRQPIVLNHLSTTPITPASLLHKNKGHTAQNRNQNLFNSIPDAKETTQST